MDCKTLTGVRKDSAALYSAQPGSRVGWVKQTISIHINKLTEIMRLHDCRIFPSSLMKMITSVPGDRAHRLRGLMGNARQCVGMYKRSLRSIRGSEQICVGAAKWKYSGRLPQVCMMSAKRIRGTAGLIRGARADGATEAHLCATIKYRLPR